MIDKIEVSLLTLTGSAPSLIEVINLTDKKFTFSLSLIAHGSFLLLGLNSPSQKNQVQQDVTLVYKNSVSAVSKSKKRRNNSRSITKKQVKKQVRKQTKNQQPIIPLSSLVPHFNSAPSMKPSKENENYKQSLSWQDSHFYDDMSLLRNKEWTSDQISFSHSLWRAIDREIEENPFLSEYNHTGKVFLRFHIRNGKLAPDSLQASASDRVLKVIAARALRKALLNIHNDILFLSDPVWINTRFSWSGYKACEQLRGVSGFNLSFCHYGENKRKSFSVGERAATWAGAISNYGPWAYEVIENYNRQERRRKSQFNPFENYERDPDWNL